MNITALGVIITAVMTILVMIMPRVVMVAGAGSAPAPQVYETCDLSDLSYQLKNPPLYTSIEATVNSVVGCACHKDYPFQVEAQGVIDNKSPDCLGQGILYLS